MPQVAIFIGSISDKEKLSPCLEVLTQLGISHIFTVVSAHRSPDRAIKLVDKLEKDGCQVFICAAGLAAHLAGTVAARTIRPVIGIPLTASSLCGLDALLSTLQMPSGYPVATVALDKPGAGNAAWLAARILALSDANLARKLRDFCEKSATDVEEAAYKLDKCHGGAA